MTTSTATMLDHVAYPLHERCEGKLISKRPYASARLIVCTIAYTTRPVIRSPCVVGPSVADPEQTITAFVACLRVAHGRDAINRKVQGRRIDDGRQ